MRKLGPAGSLNRGTPSNLPLQPTHATPDCSFERLASRLPAFESILLKETSDHEPVSPRIADAPDLYAANCYNEARSAIRANA